jgi:hypothetical protein
MWVSAYIVRVTPDLYPNEVTYAVTSVRSWSKGASVAGRGAYFLDQNWKK